MRLVTIPLLVCTLFAAYMATSQNRAEAQEIFVPASETYMTFLLDGRRVIFDNAIMKLAGNDTGISIFGDTLAQGDLPALLIWDVAGPPTVGTSTTAEENVVFSITTETGTWTTFDLANVSFGNGTYSITEITDGYVEGTFSFIADVGDEGEPQQSWTVSGGIFRASIIRF